MMRLLSKYDVAPLHYAMMRCLPQCAVRHTSFAKRTSLGVAVIICLRQTSFKKRTFIPRQKCVFCWWNRRVARQKQLRIVFTEALSTKQGIVRASVTERRRMTMRHASGIFNSRGIHNPPSRWINGCLFKLKYGKNKKRSHKSKDLFNDGNSTAIA